MKEYPYFVVELEAFLFKTLTNFLPLFPFHLLMSFYLHIGNNLQAEPKE